MSEKVTTSERNRWRWMRRYRVWSANRKSFENPENWVEPEKPGEPAEPEDPAKPRR